jgi:hypothetical protein
MTMLLRCRGCHLPATVSALDPTAPQCHYRVWQGNLLLATPPQEGGDVVLKVADFGLSRDKSQSAAMDTEQMTGCGEFETARSCSHVLYACVLSHLAMATYFSR